MPKTQATAAPIELERHGLPTGATIQATIDRMKEMATRSGDALFLSEAAPHPDYLLLDLCAEALHHRRLHDAAEAHWRANDEQRFSHGGHWTDAEQAESLAEMKAQQGHEADMKAILRKAKKLRATTAAGIYAKALIVRSSQTGAAVLAMSLAEDLIACPGLRESLWAPGAGV